MTITIAHGDYLTKRGLSPELCERLGVTSRGQSIVFQYASGRGATLFSKHRSLDKHFWIEPKGEPLRLWNLPALARHYASGVGKTLIITEGEFDAIACIQAGYEYVTSVPNGAPNVKAKPGEIIPHDDTAFSYLWDEKGLRPEVAAFSRFVIFTDNDEAGIALRTELMLRLGPERCYIPVYPEVGGKDANEILQTLGEEGLRAAIDNAFPLVPDTLCALTEIPVTRRDRRWSSGWRALDKHLILCPPELVVVTGKPGAGKSTWTLSWMLQIARRYGVPGAVIQFEDNVERTRWEVNQYVKRWKSNPDRQEKDPKTGAVFEGTNYCKDPDFIQKYLRFVAPSIEEEDTRDLAWLKNTIKEAALRHGCGWIIIDPWNEIEHLFDRSFREDQYVNNALRELKKLARQYQVALVVVAHPDKNGGRNESIDDMTLYSISGGAAWKNKSDHGIIIARDADSDGPTGQTIVKVDKSKDHREMGTPGKATLIYKKDINEFTS